MALNIQADADLVTRMRDCLVKADVTADLISALEQFSGPMFDELTGRLTMIEAKAISLLGWGTALLGFLLLQPKTPQPTVPARVLIGLATTAAVAAIVAAALASGSRKWKWPTVKHWFCEDEFSDPLRLRALHITELLSAYQTHNAIAHKKARALVFSQWSLLTAAGLVAVVLFIGLG